jgi:AcrR family transcriptional regulator
MSPRTQKQFEEIREEKKKLIMDTALKQFANEGYHNTTISQIARQAGISKGLLYNYFKSKEELLKKIIFRSMEDIFSHSDNDGDGYLTEDEFELFIRVLLEHVRKNQSFWRLFYQLLLQKDVREQFLKSYLGNANSVQKLYTGSENSILSGFSRALKDYFTRKKERMPEDYDPELDLYMFIYTLEGFAMINAYLDKVDDYYDRTIDKIIKLFK